LPDSITRNSGFSVHNEVVINENDREALVRLAQHVEHISFLSYCKFNGKFNGLPKKATDAMVLEPYRKFYKLIAL
jgi:hypothetical protein